MTLALVRGIMIPLTNMLASDRFEYHGMYMLAFSQRFLIPKTPMALTWNGRNGADADACPDQVDLETMFAGLATNLEDTK